MTYGQTDITTAADCQLANSLKITREQFPRTIFATCYEDVARVGRVREDATRKLLPWNLALSKSYTHCTG